MLGKVLKYDIKASAKMFLPMYLAVLAISALTFLYVKFLANVENPIADFVGSTTLLAYIAALIALVLMTSIFLIMRFYKNFVTDEAYLTFTLPVKTSNLVISKQINSILWNLISIAVFAAAILIVFGEEIAVNMDIIKWYMRQISISVAAEINSLSMAAKVGIVLCIIIPFVFNLTTIYASIAVGQLYTKHKVWGAVLAYIGINAIQSMLSSMILTFMGNIEAVEPFIIYMVIEELVMGIGTMAVTHYFLKNKLNLE